MLPDPIGMMSLHPIRILLVPPLSVMPYVLLVVVAVTIAPAWVERDPIRVIVIEPVGIVLMPPIGVAPLVMVVVVTPLCFGRSGRPVFIVQGLPYVRMVGEVLLQLRILPAPIGVVEQARIACECSRDIRMICQKPTKALVSLILRDIVEPWIVVREAGHLRRANLDPDLGRGGDRNRKREQDGAEPHNRFQLGYFLSVTFGYPRA